MEAEIEITLVRVRWATGHHDLDADAGWESHDFDTKEEADAFVKGVKLAMEASEGWVDASVDIEVD